MFISLSARLLVNVEALNAVESVGNLTKHRRAPLVLRAENGKYILTYVPAVSGETIAHAYQTHIVELAKLLYKEKPPLTEWDMRYEFVKFGDTEHLTSTLREVLNMKLKDQEKKHLFEKKAIEESIVADIGGFMLAERLPVRRTSRFQVGYMVPVSEALEATAIEAQLHTRNVPAEVSKEAEETAQMIYYVEVASTTYSLSFNIDLDGIGLTSLVKVEQAIPNEEKKLREKIAVAALQTLLTGTGFGAKLSRFKPIVKIENLALAMSEPVAFVVSPSFTKDYVETSILRARSTIETLGKLGIKEKIKVIVYGTDAPTVEGVGVKKVKYPEEAFLEVIRHLES